MTAPRPVATLVAWEDAYSIGLPEIDAQHKVLLGIINRLWNANISQAPRHEMREIVEDLEKYTLLHFTAEEVFMRASGFPHFEAHRGGHQAFVARLASERRKVEGPGGAVSLDLLHFLRDWLINHILVQDKEYAAAYLERREPASALGRFFKRLRA